MNEILDELNGRDRAELEAEQDELRNTQPSQVRPGLWKFGPHMIRKVFGGWQVDDRMPEPGCGHYTTIAQACTHLLAEVF